MNHCLLTAVTLHHWVAAPSLCNLVRSFDLWSEPGTFVSFDFCFFPLNISKFEIKVISICNWNYIFNKILPAAVASFLSFSHHCQHFLFIKHVVRMAGMLYDNIGKVLVKFYWQHLLLMSSLSFDSGTFCMNRTGERATLVIVILLLLVQGCKHTDSPVCTFLKGTLLLSAVSGHGLVS